MKGWILSKYNTQTLPEDSYEKQKMLDVATELGWQVDLVSPEQFELIVTRDGRKSVLFNDEVTPLPDFFLPRMGAGTTYFGLAVIRHMERLGVQVINSSNSIETVKDKLYTQQILAQSGLPVPKTMLAKIPINIDVIEKQLGFPVVVKTLSGAKGVGVYLCETPAHLKHLMDFIEATDSKINIILQEFIATSHGRDLRVFVVGGRVVACMQRSSADGDFRANYSRGGNAVAHPISPEIEWLALEATRILDLDIAGVDLLFDHNHFKICEVNSSPGFQGIESCHDISISHEIYNYIRIRLGMFDTEPIVPIAL